MGEISETLEGRQIVTSYVIDGMTCAGCLTRVRTTLQRLSPTVTVTLDPPRAVFEDAQPDERQVAEALAAIGYSARAESGAQSAVQQHDPASVMKAEAGRSWLQTYYPLLLIIGYIAVGSLAGGYAGDGFSGAFSPYGWMNAFMAGFFLVFSFFKLLDIRGFADSYRTYDLLAMRWPGYGFVYPFIEMGLGFAFLFGWQGELANAVALVVMGFSSLGVIAALRDRRQIRCACLGTVLNLPMSTVTLVEDLAMVAMAAMMLVHHAA